MATRKLIARPGNLSRDPEKPKIGRIKRKPWKTSDRYKLSTVSKRNKKGKGLLEKGGRRWGGGGEAKSGVMIGKNFNENFISEEEKLRGMMMASRISRFNVP